ncbi:hypothetical protein [uncultured Parolsenella sp.]|uniref:hypothetical protein n=1 Tax=uncultured Parolsenella sp. TaxID=2083008 RepID=UPI0027D9B1E8|nr:hypothetical protein [uncultured Parolsenella sp.]
MSSDSSPSPAARATAIVLLALALLALAACASPLSALVPGGGPVVREEDAGKLAQQYWLEKYDESRDVTEVIRPCYATSIPWPDVDTDSVVVNLGEKSSYDSLVLVDLKTGAVSDNHQSTEVRDALEAYVREGLASFGGTGRIASATIDKEATSDASTGEAAATPLTFNTPKVASSSSVFPDDAPEDARIFFSARYDGDAEAFVQEEHAAEGLSLESDAICVRLDTPAEFPTGLRAAEDAGWRKDVDPLRDWLAERFSDYPEIVVLPADDPECGWGEESPYRLGVYPAAYSGGEDAAEPLVDNWVAFGEGSEIRAESDSAGVIVTEDGLVARRLDAGSVDLDALMGDDSDWQLADVRDVYVVSLAGETLEQAQALADASQSDGLAPALDLRLSLLVPGFDYAGETDVTGSDGVWGTAEYERNYYAYVMEAGSGDGVVPATGDDRLYPMAPASGYPTNVALRDPSDALLVVVARKAT